MPLDSPDPFTTAQRIKSFLDGGEDDHDKPTCMIQVRVIYPGPVTLGELDELHQALGLKVQMLPGPGDGDEDDAESLGLDFTGSDLVDAEPIDMSQVFATKLVVHVTEPAEWCVPVDGVWYDSWEKANQVLRRREQSKARQTREAVDRLVDQGERYSG